MMRAVEMPLLPVKAAPAASRATGRRERELNTSKN